MKNPEIEILKNRIEELEDELNELDENELADKLYELVEDLNFYIENSIEEKEFYALDKLMARVRRIADDYNICFEESGLDNMVPEVSDQTTDSESI